ncbi:MAG TPA: acyl-CoA synthetase [Xanthobacteraceae bacterium]|jgi:acetyl-CoA synthetase
MSTTGYADAVRAFDWSSVLRDLGWDNQAPINLGHTIIDRHASLDGVALYWIGKDGFRATLTYRDLRASSNKVASLLRSLGVCKGDRVAGVLPRVPETIAVMIGTWKIGGIYVPIFTGFGTEAIRFRLGNCGAKVAFTHHEYRDRLPEPIELAVVTIAGGKGTGIRQGDLSFSEAIRTQNDSFDPQPSSRSDPAVILYTSGSTGEPKGVAIASNFLAAITPYMRFGVDLRPTDMFWPTGDPGWGYGFVCYHVALSMGLPVMSFEATPTAESFLASLAEHRVTNVATVPTLLRGVMALGAAKLAGYDLCLRCISSCGEPLNSEVIRFFRETRGLTPRDHFGSSENGLPLGNFNALDAEVKPGSMGLPMPGFAMSILGEEGRELPPGEVGHLAQRPSEHGYYALGYWQDPERTHQLFRHGWITAGDLARRDEAGYFWFEGRADDVIKSSGYRIGPFEVESAILHHPAVAEAAVVGKPDPLKGNIVKAYVTLRPGQNARSGLTQEIQSTARRIVGDHAYPREIEVIDSLPKTESGKIQRFRLRARVGGQGQPAAGQGAR